MLSKNLRNNKMQYPDLHKVLCKIYLQGLNVAAGDMTYLIWVS